jgi:hypothetical protein
MTSSPFPLHSGLFISSQRSARQSPVRPPASPPGPHRESSLAILAELDRLPLPDVTTVGIEEPEFAPFDLQPYREFMDGFEHFLAENAPPP